MVTLTNLATVAVLLITLGAFFVQRSAIKRAQSYKRGREEGFREQAKSQSDLDRLALELSGSAPPLTAWAGREMSDLLARLAAQERFPSSSGLEAMVGMAPLKPPSRPITPPVIPQSLERARMDVPRSPHPEQTSKD